MEALGLFFVGTTLLLLVAQAVESLGAGRAGDLGQGPARSSPQTAPPSTGKRTRTARARLRLRYAAML
jgi:hypothetical protein